MGRTSARPEEGKPRRMGTSRVRGSGSGPTQPTIPWLGDPEPCLSSPSLGPLQLQNYQLLMKGQEKDNRRLGLHQLLPSRSLGQHAYNYRRVPTRITHAFITPKCFK